MKKLLNLILISIMWLQSCSTVNPESHREIAQVSPNCHEGIANLLAPDRDFWRRLTADEKSAWQYTRGFRTITVSDEEERWLFENFMDIEYERESLAKIRSAVLFSRTLSPKQKATFLKEFPLFMNGELENLSLPTKRFSRHIRKVKKFEDKMYSFEETKAKNKLSEGRIERMRKTAHEKARIYEKNYFKCVNAVADPKHVTPEGIKRANTVALAITFGGAASAMLTYSITNWDLPKDGRWWGEIAFVIVTSMAMGYVNAKWILANPKLNLWTQRFPLVMGVSAVEDVGVTALWQEVLGTEPPTDEEIKKVMEDPAFQKKMNEMMIVMEEKGLFQKHAAAFQKMMDVYQVKSEDELVKLSGTGLMSLDPELIDDEKTRDLFLEALAELEYKEKKGPVSIGSEEYDRYGYHRAIDFVYQPAFLMASGLMYETMCSTPNPKLAVIKAVSLFLAINVAADALYFVGRRELINQ
ncbi:MAG: hypothetical protein COV37_11895 [Bdellovibrio sp. CG11_big_fil_rev_8_21_14_0_20_39_38]|nr:MAG: hypothetical protein COV37_11895 [Bdellovibrio sp. CG11_big_fil_rev_8_21_14_0_20_39_38]